MAPKRERFYQSHATKMDLRPRQFTQLTTWTLQDTVYEETGHCGDTTLLLSYPHGHHFP